MYYNLKRFIEAQNKECKGYETALCEIRRGKKTEHWIWYIFPQLKELRKSPCAKFYGIDGIDEAKAYFADPILQERLIEITQALLDLDEADPVKILGYTDAMKVKSCMTLFLQIRPENMIFHAVLDKFYDGQLDDETLALLGIDCK